jgi:hypothetical protein
MTDDKLQSAVLYTPKEARTEPCAAEPVQLELFAAFIGGSGWLPESPTEHAPNRDFCLPTSSAPASTPALDSSASGRQAPTPVAGEPGKP